MVQVALPVEWALPADQVVEVPLVDRAQQVPPAVTADQVFQDNPAMQDQVVLRVLTVSPAPVARTD